MKIEALDSCQFLFDYKYLNQSLNDLDNEAWLDLKNFKNIYKISNWGRIKKLKTPIYVPNVSKTCYSKEKIIKPSYINNGKKLYVFVRIYNSKQPIRLGLASLVASHFVNKPYGYNNLIFKDRNQLNIIPSNLAWVDNETFSFYCGAYKYIKKLSYTKEFAIKHSTDPILKKYYESGDIQLIYNYWLNLRKKFTFRNFTEIEGPCIEYIVDRLKRYSIIGDLKGLVIMYSYEARKKLKKEVSNRSVNYSLRVQVDESLTQFASIR